MYMYLCIYIYIYIYLSATTFFQLPAVPSPCPPGPPPMAAAARRHARGPRGQSLSQGLPRSKSEVLAVRARQLFLSTSLLRSPGFHRSRPRQTSARVTVERPLASGVWQLAGLCIYMYMCIYIYIYKYVYIHIYISISISISLSLSIYIYIYNSIAIRLSIYRCILQAWAQRDRWRLVSWQLFTISYTMNYTIYYTYY